MEVTKRNGAVEKFAKRKIYDSIIKANECVGVQERLTQTQIRRITDTVAEACADKESPIAIDVLENIVEQRLMAAAAYELAKKYITYRYEKERVRNVRHITEKLMATNVANQNANMDEFSFGGRMGEAASYVMREYALTNLLSPKAKSAHINNEIYTHDLDHWAIGDHNCLTLSIDHLLREGFRVRQTDIRPAGSVSTALQLVAVLFQIQSLQQFGGVSAGHLDWSLVPFYRKSFLKHFKAGLKFCERLEESEIVDIAAHIAATAETDKRLVNLGFTTGCSIDDERYTSHKAAYDYAVEMTDLELLQSVEGMYHNLNSLQSRSGTQLPFSSINYGTCTLTEGRKIIKALLEGSIAGVGKFHRTSIFPCGIFQCAKGVNRKPGDPNYDLFKLAIKSTALRLYPNYANIDWSNNAGYDVENPATFFGTMGCRTSNLRDVNAENPKLAQLKDGRGNICPVTIIMPEIAMQAVSAVKASCDGNCDNIEEKVCDAFLKLLDKKIYEAKDILLERYDWICSQTERSARFMYENGTMYGYRPEDGIRSALRHGTLAIGQIGLAETLQILMHRDHTDPDGMAMAKAIEQLFYDRCAEFKKSLKLNFAVYYTPAENLCYTSMTKFKAKYGEIAGISDKKFFTNSMHVPVWTKINPFEKIDIEAQLTGYSTGGCITYVELDASAKNNLEAVEEIVNYAMDKDIPYFAINVPSDICMSCGYQDEINDKCPQCGGTEIERLRRVTGYLSTSYENFNLGKQDEVMHRFKHGNKLSDWKRS